MIENAIFFLFFTRLVFRWNERSNKHYKINERFTLRDRSGDRCHLCVVIHRRVGTYVLAYAFAKVVSGRRRRDRSSSSSCKCTRSNYSQRRNRF